MKIAKYAYYVVKGVNKLTSKNDFVNVERSKINWALDLKEGIDLSIYLMGGFELNTVNAYKKFIKKSDVVLDIGANIGSYTLNFANFVGSGGKVYAVEPTDFAYKKLLNNIKLNPDLASQISCSQILLTTQLINSHKIYSSWPLVDTEYNLKNMHPKHFGQSMSLKNTVCQSLDCFVETNNISKINFIKMDVDGNECDVLRGSNKTLKTHKPIIGLELAPYLLEENDGTLEILLDFLFSNNYELYFLKSKKKFPKDMASINKLVVDGSSINIIAY